MVNEKVEFDAEKMGDIQKDVIHFERLTGHLIGILSKSISFCIHSGESVNELVSRLTRNFEGMKDKNGVDPSIIIQESSFLNEYDATMNNNDNGIDYIRFTSNGPVYSLPKRITNSLVGSLLYEYSQEDIKTVDGTIYLDYPYDETVAPLLIDSLMNKKICINKLKYRDQFELLRMFEYCELPMPEELMKTYYRRDHGVKPYKEGDDVILYINDKKDDILRDYLKKNGLWNKIVNEYADGYVDYDEKNNEMYLKMDYTYIDHIDEYIQYNCIYISEEETKNINSELLENEIASEHNYSKDEFHRYCDNQGETVTIIKHIGNNNHINIFGGYTDQSWDSSGQFLFTLSNEHGISPTKYDYAIIDSSYGIGCSSSYGPVFGYGHGIHIYDQCHSNTNSYCYAHSYSEVNTPQKSSLFVNTDDANSANMFTVEDYEVWGRV
ncbi:hypothetical protein WA158_000228 [Blastocystis sp. Blastoise]